MHNLLNLPLIIIDSDLDTSSLGRGPNGMNPGEPQSTGRFLLMVTSRSTGVFDDIALRC